MRFRNGAMPIERWILHQGKPDDSTYPEATGHPLRVNGDGCGCGIGSCPQNRRTIMLLNAQRAQLNLADDEVARLRDACDSRLEVTQGFVWLTVEGDRNDVVLGAGESFLIDSRDVVTVSAIRGAASLQRARQRRRQARAVQAAAARGTAPEPLPADAGRHLAEPGRRRLRSGEFAGAALSVPRA